MCRVTRELPAPIQLPTMANTMQIAPPALPQPALHPSTAHNVMVKTADNRFENKEALVSRCSNIYEMGPILREGKFGSIRVAAVLKNTTKDNEYERSNEKPVALKVYSMEKMKDIRGNAVENPWLEIEIQQLIGNKHPNLVGVIETCIVEHNLFIVLPFFTGGDLLDVIENRFMGPLPIFHAKKMFSQIMNGLKFLHENGIAHRDLSIENVLYDDSTDTYAICDFGMALRVPRDPVTGLFLPLSQAPACGKEGYIAPELWKREPLVDIMATDIWACGVILFMALTGSAPMQRATEWDPYYQMIANKQLLEMLGDMSIDMDTYAGLDLVQAILEPTPRLRPTVHDLLQHSWLSC